MIDVTVEYAVVIRKAGTESRFTREQLRDVFDGAVPHAEDDKLIVFGPSFGEDALAVFIGRLEALGMTYFDDFFDLHIDCPSWVRFGVSSV
jgi:hypothetical protein